MAANTIEPRHIARDCPTRAVYSAQILTSVPAAGTYTSLLSAVTHTLSNPLNAAPALRALVRAVSAEALHQGI